MKKYILDLKVVDTQQLGDRYVLLKLTSDTPLPEMIPGQFAELKIEGSPHTYMRRPISINYVDLSKMPAYIMQFPEYSDVLDYYYIVVKSARRTRITSFFEMLPSLSSDYAAYDSTSGNTSVAQSYTETYMTSLIKTVTID